MRPSRQAWSWGSGYIVTSIPESAASTFVLVGSKSSAGFASAFPVPRRRGYSNQPGRGSPRESATARTITATTPATRSTASTAAPFLYSDPRFRFCGRQFAALPVELGGEGVAKPAGELGAAEIIACGEYPKGRPHETAGIRAGNEFLEIEREGIVLRVAGSVNR